MGKKSRPTSTILNELIFSKLKRIYGVREKNNGIELCYISKPAYSYQVVIHTSNVFHGNHIILNCYSREHDNMYPRTNYTSIYHINVDTLTAYNNYILRSNNAIERCNSFKLTDKYNIPRPLLHEPYNTPDFLNICTSIKSCDELSTFRLCLYRKISSIDIRNHIMSYIYLI